MPISGETEVAGTPDRAARARSYAVAFGEAKRSEPLGAAASITAAGPKIHPARKQIGALTGLRFFAATYVFVFHFGAGFAQRSRVPDPIITFLRNGFLGVSIFFVLSGFILTYTYKQRVDSPQMFA